MNDSKTHAAAKRFLIVGASGQLSNAASEIRFEFTRATMKSEKELRLILRDQIAVAREALAAMEGILDV